MMYLTRRRLTVALLLLLVGAFAAVAWGPAPLAQRLSDGWNRLCGVLGWQQRTAAKSGAQAAGPVNQSNPIIVAAGDAAPDFVLRDLDGAEFRLGDRRGKRPVVIEFGSYT